MQFHMFSTHSLNNYFSTFLNAIDPFLLRFCCIPVFVIGKWFDSMSELVNKWSKLNVTKFCVNNVSTFIDQAPCHQCEDLYDNKVISIMFPRRCLDLIYSYRIQRKSYSPASKGVERNVYWMVIASDYNVTQEVTYMYKYYVTWNGMKRKKEKGIMR